LADGNESSQQSSEHLFFADNSIEQVWKWIKPFVYAAKTMEKGCKEIITRFHKIMTAWINKQLANPPNIGIGAWQNLLFKYL